MHNHNQSRYDDKKYGALVVRGVRVDGKGSSVKRKKRPVPRGFRKDAETMTQYQLSVKDNATVRTVKKWLDKLGIDRGYARCTDEEDETLRELVFDQGLSLSETARRMNRPVSTVSKHVDTARIGAARGKPWSVEEIDKLREMAEAGFTYEEAAQALGRGKGSVRYKATQLKLFLMYSRHERGALCWKCANAVPNPATGVGCEWSRKFQPVPGWEAEYRPIKLSDAKISESYFVKSCPLFAEG